MASATSPVGWVEEVLSVSSLRPQPSSWPLPSLVLEAGGEKGGLCFCALHSRDKATRGSLHVTSCGKRAKCYLLTHSKLPRAVDWKVYNSHCNKATLLCVPRGFLKQRKKVEWCCLDSWVCLQKRFRHKIHASVCVNTEKQEKVEIPDQAGS
jgi:hypothetical protein